MWCCLDTVGTWASMSLPLSQTQVELFEEDEWRIFPLWWHIFWAGISNLISAFQIAIHIKPYCGSQYATVRLNNSTGSLMALTCSWWKCYFHVMYMSTWPALMHMHQVHTWCNKEQKTAVSNPLDLKFQVVVSNLWLLKTKARSFTRPARVLFHEAFPTALSISFVRL